MVVMHNEDVHTTLAARLKPPTEAKTSVILNGVGNGMMIGAAPFIAAETYSGITGWRIPKGLHWVNAALTIGGVAWGYFSGQKEFRRLQDYRQTVSNEILKLNDHITASDTEIKSWADKVRKPEADVQSEIAR